MAARGSVRTLRDDRRADGGGAAEHEARAAGGRAVGLARAEG